MSEFANPASDAQDAARAYTNALLGVLGRRDPVDVLRETPDALRRAAADLSAARLATPERAGKWSMAQVIFHLCDSELVGAFRFRMVLAHDRPTLPGYDQDRWVARLHASDADVGEALDEFARLRGANVRLFERLTDDDRRRVGLHLERGEESVERMLRLYAGHDLVHLRQLARIRAAVEGA
jgi:DinB superfamily